MGHFLFWLREGYRCLFPFILGNLIAIFTFKSFFPLHCLLLFLSLGAFYTVSCLMAAWGPCWPALSRRYRFFLSLFFTIIVISGLVTGIWLVDYTGLPAFVLGVFIILCSFGPCPYLKEPYQRPFSFFCQTAFLFFLSLYVHIYPLGSFALWLEGPVLFGAFHLGDLFTIFLLSIPLLCTTLQLSFGSGTPESPFLFQRLSFAGYAGTALCILLGYLPWTCIFVFATIWPVLFNNKQWEKSPDKTAVAYLATRNYLYLNGFNAICIALYLFLPIWKPVQV